MKRDARFVLQINFYTKIYIRKAGLKMMFIKYLDLILRYIATITVKEKAGKDNKLEINSIWTVGGITI